MSPNVTPAVVQQVRALLCPNCGGSVQLRGAGRTVNAVCPNCHSVLDATDTSLRIVQKSNERKTIEPLIPLGQRGTLRGILCEHIGFQQRCIMVDGEQYCWQEYLLFNPYHGYRYLTVYDGHWSLVKSVRTLPKAGTTGGKAMQEYGGRKYRFFQSARARTAYVMGEFPYQVRRGEAVEATDYVSPPYMLSSEKTGNEITWSLGEYLPGKEVWSAFKLSGSAPDAVGVYANQPSPISVAGAWLLYVLFTVLLFGLSIGAFLVQSNKTVFEQSYYYVAQTGTEASYVTPVFNLEGRPSTVEVEIKTDLDNEWAYFSLALINDDNGDALDFGREVSYYHGRDSDGNWSEGGKTSSVLLPSVPAGRYYLRVEPEMEARPTATTPRSVSYSLRVRRDVPAAEFPLIGFGLLLIPPVWVTIRSLSFEQKRWAESGGNSE